jgi:hypothetical protein
MQLRLSCLVVWTALAHHGNGEELIKPEVLQRDSGETLHLALLGKEEVMAVNNEKIVSHGFMKVEGRAAVYVKIITLRYNARNARRFIWLLRFGNKEALQAMYFAPLGAIEGPIGAAVTTIISAAIKIGAERRKEWANRIQHALRRTPHRGVIVELGISIGFFGSSPELRAKPRK